MNMRQLKTKWADNINEKNVLGEYPRPLMRRKSYVNLNGVWKYAIKDTKGFPKKMNGDKQEAAGCFISELWISVQLSM